MLTLHVVISGFLLFLRIAKSILLCFLLTLSFSYFFFPLYVIVPSMVVNLTKEGVTDTSISLSWKEPVDRNGIIVSYLVEWGESDDSDEKKNDSHLNTADLNYNITNLRPYTNYTVSVYATTSAGQGPHSPITVETLTGCELLMFS